LHRKVTSGIKIHSKLLPDVFYYFLTSAQLWEDSKACILIFVLGEKSGSRNHLLLFYCKEIELKNRYKGKLTPLFSMVGLIGRCPLNLVEDLLEDEIKGLVGVRFIIFFCIFMDGFDC